MCSFLKYTYENHRICTALEKTVHFGTNTIVNEIRSQGQCAKDVQLLSLVVQHFKWLYSFSKIYIWGPQNLYIFGKTVHSGTHTIVKEIKSQRQRTKDVQLLNGCTDFKNYTYEDHRICTALEKTVHFSTNTIVNEIRSQGHCTKDVQLFSLVVQCFKWLSSFSKIYIYEDHRIYTALEKLYILVHTPLSIKFRAKGSVY